MPVLDTRNQVEGTLILHFIVFFFNENECVLLHPYFFYLFVSFEAI